MIFRDSALRENASIRAIGFGNLEGWRLPAEGMSASRATFGNDSGSQMIK